jgi:hypothetical protein
MGCEGQVLVWRVADLPHCSSVPLFQDSIIGASQYSIRRAGRAGWGGAIVQNKANLERRERSATALWEKGYEKPSALCI